jgi:hypothetical protein
MQILTQCENQLNDLSSEVSEDQREKMLLFKIVTDNEHVVASQCGVNKLKKRTPSKK